MSTVATAKAAKPLNATEHRIRRHLQRAVKPLSAYEIQNDLGIRHPNTVYRALEKLLGFGFVHRLETQNAFVACDKPSKAHAPAFIICADCGAVEEINVDSVVPMLQARLHERRFVVEKTAIELICRCYDCPGRASKRPGQDPHSPPANRRRPSRLRNPG